MVNAESWGRKIADPLAAAVVHRNLNPRLRIGYISSDFRAHVVSYFIEPILAAHDQDSFDIYCYSNEKFPDPNTL